MTTNQFNASQLLTMQTYINEATTAYDAGNYSAAQQALSNYYTFQANLGRGYAVLANQVVTDQGAEGQAALGIFSSIAGPVSTSNFTNLMLKLATADNALMQGSGNGIWPQTDQIADYHYTIYDQLDFPVQAWGGAALAYYGGNIGPGVLTAAEISANPTDNLYNQNLTYAQLFQNIGAVDENGALQFGAAFNGVNPLLGWESVQQAINQNLPNVPSLADVGAGVNLEFDVYNTLETNSQSGNIALGQDLNSALQYIGINTGKFLQEIGSFLGEHLNPTTDANGTELQTALANFTADEPYLHVTIATDTWASLASANDTTVAILQALNPLLGTGTLATGSVVELPISITTGTPSSATLSGLTDAGYYDANTNQWITAPISLDGSDGGHVTVIDGSGNATLTFDAAPISLTSTSGVATAVIDGSGDKVVYGTSGTASIENSSGTTLSSYSSGQLYSLDPVSTGTATVDTVLTNSNIGTLLDNYTLNGATGGISATGAIFEGSDFSGTWAQYQSAAAAISTALPSVYTTYTPTAAVDNTTIYGYVSPLGSGFADGFASNGEVSADSTDSGYVPGNDVITGPGLYVQVPFANDIGVFSDLPTDVATDDLQPGQGRYIPDSENDALLNAEAAGGEAIGQYLASQMALSGNAYGQNDTADTDPLLIDLTGNGIQVSNWIDNDVYFQSNVNTTTTPETEDTSLHHTSWMQSGTGMLVFDPSDTAITNINQTVSEYLNISTTTTAVGSYADGLAALSALATVGSTVFSAATSKTDPNTGVKYWNEIYVATGTPGSTGVIASSQLETLATALGSTGSISLVGSGNQGQDISGSAVTNQTTYTTSTGTTGEAAAVNLQIDTTGDFTYNQANGSLVISSTSEGGPSPTTSYVDQASTPQTLTLESEGGLQDDGAAVAQYSSEPYNAVFAQAGDTVSVASGDNSSYWLSGENGTTLNGGAGDTMFLVNAGTVVNADYTGNNFNIEQVMDDSPITINLASQKIQEVIGGAGDGTFNASGTYWNVYIQGGSGNNIIIGGSAYDALSGGTGDDIIKAGTGGSDIHAGSGNDVIYGGSGTTVANVNGTNTTLASSDIIYGGPGNDTVVLGTDNSAVYAGTGSMTVIGNDTQTNGVGATAFSTVIFSGSYADYTVSTTGGVTTVTDKDSSQNGPVTLENVTDIGFSDIGQVPLASTPGMPVDDTIEVHGDTTYTIQASALLANDIDYSGAALYLQGLESSSGTLIGAGQSGAVTGGTVVLSTNGTTINFTPTPGYTGIMSFRYYVENASGQVAEVQQYNGSNVATGSPAEMSATVTLVTPNDPTDSGFASEWYLQAADVLPAWQAGFTGQGISVAVFDPSGNVDFTNPDLAPNEGGEFSAENTPGIAEIGTHATLVAGVIAAADNGEGDIGVAYNATLSSEATPNPTGPTITFSQLLDWSNYQVVNNSWGFENAPYGDAAIYGSTVDYDLYNAVMNGNHGLGTTVVFSAGNSRSTGGNTNQSVLTASPYEITVGGIYNQADIGSLQVSASPFSNPGASILVSAPANDIATTGTVLTNEYGQQYGDTTESAAGTSMSAPIVSGVVALMLQANPNLGARDIQEILADTATEVPNSSNFSTTWTTNAATDWNGGGMHVSNDYGFGEVDAAAAVRLAQTWNRQDTFANAVTAAADLYAGYSDIATVTPGAGTTLTQINTNASLATEDHGYTVSSGNLVLNDSSSSYIDFNSTGSSLDGITEPGAISVEDIQVSLTVQFASEAVQTTQSLESTQQTDMLEAANALLSEMTVTLYDGTITSTLMSPLIATGDTAAAGATISTSGSVDTSQFVYTFDTVQDWNESDVKDYQLGVSYASGTTASGVITAAGISIDGDAEPTGQGGTYIYTNEYAGTTTLTDSGTNVTLNASPTSGNITLDANAGTTDSTIEGHALDIASSTTHITTIDSGAGNDTIIANGSGDTIDGGQGSDTIYAGAGADTIEEGASDGQDKIYSFGYGTASTHDTLALQSPVNSTAKLTDVVGTLPGLIGFDSSGNVITTSSTGSEISQAGMGSNWNFVAAVDVNGDGLADILWRNITTGTASGEVDLWVNTGNGYIDEGVIGTVPTTYNYMFADPAKPGLDTEIVWGDTSASNGGYILSSVGADEDGTTQNANPSGGEQLTTQTYTVGTGTPTAVFRGDFNGDGKSDILFQWGGALAVWELNGTTELSNSYVYDGSYPVNGSTVSVYPYQVVGVGYYTGPNTNGLLISDIMFENYSTGNIQYWFMYQGPNGPTVSSSASFTQDISGADYLGAADITGDGEQDAIWWSTSGSTSGNVYSWHISAGAVQQSASLGTLSPTGYRFVGIGDFNGDGKDDLVWQSASSSSTPYAVTIWWSGLSTNSTTLALSTPITSVSAIADVLDSVQVSYGSSQNSNSLEDAGFIGVSSSGAVITTSETGVQVSQAGLGSGWTRIGAVDTNGDGLTDILWQNTSNGEIDLWTNTGSGYTDRGIISTENMTGWTLLAADPASGMAPAQLLWEDGSANGVIQSWTVTDTGSGTVNVTPAALSLGNNGSNETNVGVTVATNYFRGDFNGDGHSDILFQWAVNPYDWALVIWTMDGTTVLNDYYVQETNGTPYNGSSAAVSTSYSILAVADFNGDGTSDILWENGSGRVAYWFMGGQYGNVNLSQLGVNLDTGSDWTFMGTAALVAQGREDVIWRAEGSNSNHAAVYMWDIQNGALGVNEQIGSVSNTDNYIGAADLNGDGLDDLVWQDSSTLAVSIWWDGQQSNSTVVQLGTQLTSLSVLPDLLPASATTSSTTLEGVTANQISPYSDITGATTLDDSALPGSLTINLSGTGGPTATHFQNVIGNNAGDTITANALGGTLTGGTGNDTFNGGAGSDIFIGGGGTNTMIGGGGTDSYQISANDAVDTITNGVSTNNTAAGQVDFLASSDQNLWFAQSGNNLVIDVLGTTQQVVLQNWYSNIYAQVSEIEDSSSLKLDTALSNLVTAMATFRTNNATFNPQTTTDTSLTNSAFYGTLTTTVSNSWHS